MRHLDGLFHFLTGKRSAWYCVVIAILVSGAAMSLLSGNASTGFPEDGLPDSAESAQVSALLDDMPSNETTSAIVVYDRDGEPLTEADQAAIAEAATAIAAQSTVPAAVQPRYGADGTAAIVVVPLDAAGADADVKATAEQVRTAATQGLPDGLTVHLTGPVGFRADIAGAFAGAHMRLLVVTASIVALLLIVTYRSPVLWLVPLTVIGVGDGIARQVVVSLGSANGVAINASVSGIVSVLVFGAGTNYALLLVARYREELYRVEDHREAMRRGLRSTYPAILASGSTVILSLLTLQLADLGSNRTLGWACAVGIAIAMGAALLVLPPALTVCGRRLFWPFVPRVEPDRPRRPQVWERLGRRVQRHPGRTIIVSTLGLALLACGAIGLQVGLPQTSQFVGTPDSVKGQEIVADAFGAGATAQTQVVVPDAAAQATAALIAETAGVAAVTESESANGLTVLAVTLEAPPGSDGAYATIERLRDGLHAAQAPVNEALVGGSDATGLDTLRFSERDQRLIGPVILAVVFTILVLLLRSLVAPVLLVLTVLATFAAAMGAGNVVFTRILDYPGLDTTVPLFSFLFLVALGVDYNIFLTTRAREERHALGTREGMLRALAATGGVITSAGILLAAVFAVLGLLPVVALMQIGVIVCIGVLLDTLVVRTLMVPSLAFWLGDRFWWPAREGARGSDEALSADAVSDMA